MLVGIQDRDVGLALDAVALLGDVDAVRADGCQEIKSLVEVSGILLEGLRDQEAGVPLAGDPHAAEIQSRLQLSRILRILVADLAALEACERHLADDLLEGVLRTKLRHIIVAPADGGDAQEYLALIKHSHTCILLQ